MKSEKTKQSHATMEVAKALAAAAAASGTVQAALQTARERTTALGSSEDGTRLRQETAHLSQLAAEVGVGLASLAAAAEVQAWTLGRAGQREEQDARVVPPKPD